MYNFMSGRGGPGNPNLAFAAGAAPSNIALPTKPTQDQIGGGMDADKAIMLMSMLGNKGGSPTQTFGPEYNGGSGGNPMFQTQRDPAQMAYQQAIMKALLGGRM